MQRTANPINMRLLMIDESPKITARQSFRNFIHAEHLAHHQKHDPTAIHIDGIQALADFGGGQGCRRSTGWNIRGWSGRKVIHGVDTCSKTSKPKGGRLKV